MSGTLDFLEVATRRTIVEIMERHRAELAPHFKVLCDIEAIRPPHPIYITKEQVDALQLQLRELIG